MVCVMGCGLFTKLFQGKSTIVGTEPPTLASPPRPAVAIKGTPEDQSVYFADLVASPDTRLAGWLGLYDALGIPVIGQDGLKLGSTGDDPIGPQYWQIWYASGLDKKGRGIPLSDAGRLLAVGTPEMDGATLGATLLNDLRLALKSSDPQVRLMGMFIRERIKRWPSHLDIQDASVKPENAIIDLPSVQMITWIAMRGALMQSAHNIAGFIQQPDRDYRVAALLQSQGQLTTTTPCSAILGNSDVTYWANWTLRKVAARGLQLPGMEKAIPGLVERLLQTLTKGIEKGRAAEMVGTMRNGLAWLNAVTSVLTLAMRLAAMEITAVQEPDPLVRTHGTNHGKEGKITFFLSANPQKPSAASEVDPDGNALGNCLGSFLASAAGLTMSFPPAGPIAGAELQFEGGEGFPNLVLFGNYNDVFPKATNSNGEASIDVIGHSQKNQIPDSAKPVDKEFSIIVSAQPEAYNGNTIVNTFFNGFTFGVRPNAPSGITAIVDILKTVHWDLGEQVFRLTDWQQSGYRATGGDGPTTYSGTICSLDKEFTVIGHNGPLDLTFKFTPSGDGRAGTATLRGSVSVATWIGDGPYTIEGFDSEKPKIVWVTHQTVSGKISGSGTFHIDLVPLETDECGGG
jgi:hypothetical protein